MTTLDRVVLTVNQELPDYTRGVFRPRDMLRTRASSCVGRAALAYTLLRATGTPDSAMQLLIDTTHGTPRAPGKYWRGHTALAVTTDPGALIDSNDDSYVQSLDVVTRRPDASQPECSIGHQNYTVHDVPSGLIYYQQSHPELANGPLVTIEDYEAIYGGLASAADLI